MEFAKALLKREKAVKSLRDLGLSTGNADSDYVKAARLAKFDKVQEILDDCKTVAEVELNLTAVSVIIQLMTLLDMDDITTKDRLAVWKEIAELAGLKRNINENINRNETDPAMLELMQKINDKLTKPA